MNNGSVRAGSGTTGFDPPNQKHAATSARNATALIKLVVCWTRLLVRRPVHCKAPKKQMIATPTMLSRPARDGTNAPKNSPNAIDAYAIAEVWPIQSVQPTVNPTASPNARRENTKYPPVSGSIVPSSVTDAAASSA